MSVSHCSHLRSMPSMVKRLGLDVNHKTTPIHMEVFEEGDKHSGDGRDSLTENNIELVNTKLLQIAASREKNESDLNTFVGLKIHVSEGDEEATDEKAKEKTGTMLINMIMIIIHVSFV
jgi:hypothetical protein